MKTLHSVLIVVSWAAAILAQGDPNYLAHGLYHPDILAVVPLVGADIPAPGGVSWADSYSIDNKCYCIQKAVYGNGIDQYPVETPNGWMTVKQACNMIGPGPGASGRPIYNDVQCGNGPPNNLGNEHLCPGRVDIGKNGCAQIGPTWNFDEISTLPLPPTSSPVGETVFFRDVGNGDAQDTQGLSGQTWPYKSTKGVSGTSNPEWFQTHRSGPKFTYVLEGFTPNQNYRVELGFAEVWGPNCSPGKRVQKIFIQNQLVKDNVDVYALAGCRTAYLEVFDGNKAITANGLGRIRIVLEAVVENAMLSTIKIESATNTPPPPSPPPPPPSPGGVFKDVGKDDAQDKQGLSGQTWKYSASPSRSIAGTSDDQWFRTHRSGEKFTYLLDGFTPDQKYRVELGFAEVWVPNCSPGKRVQKIFIQNQLVKDNMDVYALAGCNTAYLEVFDGNKAITANGLGRIRITLEAVVENAMLSTIKIEPATNTPPPPSPSPAPGPPGPSPTGMEKIVIDAGSIDEQPILAEGKTWTYATSSSVVIEGTTQRAKFRTHRSAPRLYYVIPGLTPGSKYKLVLGFAEVWGPNCANDKRVMDIKVNGQTKTEGLDVFREAGGCETALLKTYNDVTANSQGKLNFEITASKENGMVSLIEISAAAVAAAPAAAPAAAGDNMSIDVGSNGGEDTSLISGNTVRYGKSGSPTQVPLEYRTHRWGGDFKYTVDGFVPGKTYIVQLGFAEAYANNCVDGKRRFRVKINGQTVESNLDVHESAGGCATNGKKLLRTYERQPDSAGIFEIGFERIENNAMVSLIEIDPK